MDASHDHRRRAVSSPRLLGPIGDARRESAELPVRDPDQRDTCIGRRGGATVAKIEAGVSFRLVSKGGKRPMMPFAGERQFPAHGQRLLGISSRTASAHSSPFPPIRGTTESFRKLPGWSDDCTWRESGRIASSRTARDGSLEGPSYSRRSRRRSSSSLMHAERLAAKTAVVWSHRDRDAPGAAIPRYRRRALPLHGRRLRLSPCYPAATFSPAVECRSASVTSLKHRCGQLYYESDLFRDATRPELESPPGATRCPHATTCQGGLRCLSYAINRRSLHGRPGVSSCLRRRAEERG